MFLNSTESNPYGNDFQIAEFIPPNDIVKVRKKLEGWVEKNNIPGAAIQIYWQGLPYSYFLGVESHDTQIPVSGKTVFEIGSLTKLFTTLLFAQAIKEKKINFNDSITKYLPTLAQHPQKIFQEVTLKKLATHTAGLPVMVPETVLNPTDLFSFLVQYTLLSTPGTEWRYSNVGTGLLANAIEMAIQQDINELYINRLLRPLNMENIGLHLSESFQSHYAQGYTKEGHPVPHTHYAQDFDENGKAKSYFELSLLPEAGAMKMTAEDGLHFLKAAVGMPNVPTPIAEAMKMTQTAYIGTQEMNQGFGWVIYPFNHSSKKFRKTLLNPNAYMNRWPEPAQIINDPIFDDDALMDKTGLTTGFRSYIAVIPNKKSGIVILTNRHALNSEIMKIGREILFDITAKKP